MEILQIASFIAHWQNSGGAERANYVLFLTQLCDLLGVPQPDDETTPPAKATAKLAWPKTLAEQTKAARVVNHTQFVAS